MNLNQSPGEGGFRRGGWDPSGWRKMDQYKQRRVLVIMWYWCCHGASLVAQMVQNPPATQETWVRSLAQEDALEEEMATHSSILAWRIPWHDWTTKHTYILQLERSGFSRGLLLSLFLCPYWYHLLLINSWGQTQNETFHLLLKIKKGYNCFNVSVFQT